MKNNKLFKANLLISVILVVGFLLTAVLSSDISKQTLFCWPVGMSCLVIGGMILAILLIINSVIRRFHTQVTELVEERQAYFKKATEQLYESIYEMNLTRNCYVGKTTEEYFKSMGAGGLPFDQGLRVIAKKQIKEEYQDGYISMFSPDHAIREYQAGNNHLRYDFMSREDGGEYRWMRVDAYLFYSEESRSVHMFAYRKNIDREKKKELLAATDEMTGLYSKKVTERLIKKQILESGNVIYAFFIFDIDNFKQVNDTFGHSFGDFCICRFTQTIRDHFGTEDILGRIGGDEFVAFTKVSGREEANRRAEELTGLLNMLLQKDDNRCRITASLGVALYPADGVSFEELYLSADEALYRTKQRGKNGYTLKEEETGKRGETPLWPGDAWPDNSLAVMQSQIQPHFLYNSLIGIKQLCDTDPGRASEALQHFCLFLRQNLESLSDMNLIPFEKEMIHVREFLYLEKMRFGDKLSVETRLLATDFLLPSLTLQPLVENAVRHGIRKKKGGGTVTIKTEESGQEVIITVADDGAGFDTGKMPEDGQLHLGLSNVRKRLEAKCGGSLQIQSKRGVGTVATIILPLRRNVR